MLEIDIFIDDKVTFYKDSCEPINQLKNESETIDTEIMPDMPVPVRKRDKQEEKNYCSAKPTEI